ncbi:gamma-glutamyl-gamma-aminobutyrate hydrolase family protein [Streptococcus suis]|uniref:gamma-glutamyl-gamma-aminobutyrate hydrolase family protein n=1 Tax=Streptococcus suis TaxID=1307 RepID=UPI001ABEBF90|nr:gamma-glutamyl-gamma-aminobutyrate hydrolase family protein [Streptococcus suis]MBO4110701.1 gamma-glutamyl-gamma-aminobutyrate hydrolase family protein [Streptococcus suis]MDG3137231.1 gamma-glutamyl-gamma-aminobutyrate hydrolase family protein [Streptococcus suis]
MESKCSKPIIGISASIIVDSGGMFPGYHRAYVNEDYVNSVIRSGGIPLIIPISQDETVIDGYIGSIDGLILSGGHDVNPLNYDEEPDQKLGDIFPLRDWFDSQLLQKAKEKRIPILGICRGCQIINVSHGGSLWQDLSYAEGVTIKHWQAHHPDLATHSIVIEEDSVLYHVLGEKKVMVNSFHHQVIRKVGDGFRVVARARDGVIEAIESTDYPFMIGVQWHPEMLHHCDAGMCRLFKALVEAAQGMSSEKILYEMAV